MVPLPARRDSATTTVQRRFSSPHAPHAILFIDDDPVTRETVNWGLSLAGLDVHTAESGAQGLALARLTRFHLMLVDQLLPDMLGTDFVRTLQNEGWTPPFVLVSGFLTTAITVEAMKLGAIDVMEKPVDIDDLVPIVCEALDESGARGHARAGRRLVQSADESRGLSPAVRDSVRPGSAAERWALHVLKACDSTRDLKTIEDWAAFTGVSYTSLRESCHLLGISPHEARDLMRLLRAVLKARHYRCSPEVLLDVSDGRTLEKLWQRAGFSGDTEERLTPRRFLRDQHFVSRENAGMRVLMLLLARRVPSDP